MTAPGWGGELAGRLTLSALAAFLLAEFRYYAPALTLLLFAIAMDYITGMVRAWLQGGLSSAVGLRGLVKKLCYMLGVCVGFCVDLLLLLAADSFGMGEGVHTVFGMLGTVMLIGNELLSVLENLGQIGVPLPQSLTAALSRLQDRLGERDEKGG